MSFSFCQKTNPLLRILTTVLYSFLTLIGCSQPPADRAHAEDEAFDQKISRTISFTVPTIGVGDLVERQDQMLILDARDRKEFDMSHIPNATFIGYKNWDKNVLKDVSKDTPIVLYCSIGYRSEKIGEKLLKMGYTNVKNLYGSIFEWVNQGNPIVDKNQLPTNNIHTYNEKWSQWVTNDSIQKKW